MNIYFGAKFQYFICSNIEKKNKQVVDTTYIYTDKQGGIINHEVLKNLKRKSGTNGRRRRLTAFTRPELIELFSQLAHPGYYIVVIAIIHI